MFQAKAVLDLKPLICEMQGRIAKLCQLRGVRKMYRSGISLEESGIVEIKQYIISNISNCKTIKVYKVSSAQ